MAVGLAQSGLRNHTLITNNRDLIYLCLPSTPKGTAKIDASRGVKIGYIYYWSPAFKDPRLAHLNVPVRYDPNDKSMALVWLKDHWEICESEYANIFRGRTEKEVDLITQEITAQNKRTGQRRTINAMRIAKYLSDTRAAEDVLQQRQRDQERCSAQSKAPAQPIGHSGLDALEEAIWGSLEGETDGD
jgi:hypothetical protein